MSFPERENCLWTAVRVRTDELCVDGKEPNINYILEPYSWWFCCDKMKSEMNESIKWNDRRAFLYIEKPTGYEEYDEVQIYNCPFCAKPIKIEETERLTYWRNIIKDRYKLKYEN